jgi:Spy/CpxP family protein refolding chaperone
MAPTQASIPATQRLRLIAVALVVSAAGVCASIAQAQPAAGPRGEAPHAMHRGPMGGFMGGRMLERALDSVNATTEQRTRIRDIIKPPPTTCASSTRPRAACASRR